MSRYLRLHEADRKALDALWAAYDAAAKRSDVRRPALRSRIMDAAATLAVASYDPGVARLTEGEYPLDPLRWAPR